MQFKNVNTALFLRENYLKMLFALAQEKFSNLEN